MTKEFFKKYYVVMIAVLLIPALMMIPVALQWIKAESQDLDAEYAISSLEISNGSDCVGGMNRLQKLANQGYMDAQGALEGYYDWGCPPPHGWRDPDIEIVNPAEAYYWHLVLEKTNKDYPTLLRHAGSTGSGCHYRQANVDPAKEKEKAEREHREYLARYEKHLTKEQIDAVKKRVEEWKPLGIK
ncbi:MAG: hypothetical protein EPN97_04820 [Alphaproteobacteria bacterium]|nr:MAG: hypothetical protein EPN97_04820 [Alphaproteobacteria bacterium]